MAILFFYINKEKGNKIDVKLDKHKGEKETDLSYKWGQYALEKSIELNFENIFVNPYVEDQGARIHVLSGEIMSKNNLDCYGQPSEFSHEPEFLEDDEGFNEYRTTFEPSTADEGADVIVQQDEYVHIVLDMNEASKFIGGFNTPTAISAGAVYKATKEHAEELAEDKEIMY